MPLFSFFFVFVVVFSILNKMKVLGDMGINLFVSFIMAIIFISFSSLELYVRTIVPWFVVLLICTFLILALAGFASKDFGGLMTGRFGWVLIGILVAIFLIAAIKVFNPVFHPDLIIASGEGTSLVEQISYAYEGRVFGTLLLIGIAGVVSFIIAKK